MMKRNNIFGVFLLLIALVGAFLLGGFTTGIQYNVVEVPNYKIVIALVLMIFFLIFGISKIKE